MHHARLMGKSTFLRFLAVGVVNTACGLVTIYALKAFAAWNDVPANMGGYAVGLTVSFVLNRQWTFAHRGAMAPALLRFLVVWVIAYGANLGLMLYLRDHWQVNAYLAHALATMPFTLLSFAGSRWFAFAQRDPVTAQMKSGHRIRQ